MQLSADEDLLLAILMVVYYDGKRPGLVGLNASSGCFTAHWFV